MALLLVGGCAAEAAPPVACVDPTYYRVDQVHIPYLSGEFVAASIDLDRDGTVDNQIANIDHGVHMYDTDLGDTNAIASARLAGEVTWFVSKSTCDDGTTHVELGGSGGGEAVPLTALVDPLGTHVPVAWVRPVITATELDISDNEARGTIAFAIPMPDATHALLEPYAEYLSVNLAAGKSAIAKQMDQDHDGVVTVDELLHSDLVLTLISPDIKDANGTPYALSAGMSIHATRVAL